MMRILTLIAVVCFFLTGDLLSQTVYITETGEKYHSAVCHHLARSKVAVELQLALEMEKTPCSVCDPPIEVTDHERPEPANKVYTTKTGTKYHRSGCRHLRSKIEIDLEVALKLGKTACSVCKP